MNKSHNYMTLDNFTILFREYGLECRYTNKQKEELLRSCNLNSIKLKTVLNSAIDAGFKSRDLSRDYTILLFEIKWLKLISD